MGTSPAFGGSSTISPNGAFVAAASMANKRPPPPPPPARSKPNVQYVIAVYDFVAQVRNMIKRLFFFFFFFLPSFLNNVFVHDQADGDLSFKAGDRIEIVERSANAEEWWTGRLNGVQGVFPGKILLKRLCIYKERPAWSNTN
jgi:amphiphysin